MRIRASSVSTAVRLASLAGYFVVGCGGTVYRLPGEATVPGGAARTPCESEDWLVIAPTRAEVTSERTKTSHRENGLGLYRVGRDSPEAIPSIQGFDSKSVRRKREELEPYDRKQIVAGTLGTVGAIAIAVGAILFVNSFDSKATTDAMGNRKENNTVNGGKLGVGAGFVGVGFGLGIAGLVVNPTNAERTESSATRHVFFDPPDDAKSVENLVAAHNADVRQTCAAGH